MVNKGTLKNKRSSHAETLMTPMSNASVVDRIISRITNAIIQGELIPGQKIPTEAELCESMQVGRNSVREAIKALVAMGVLIIRRAEGTFVAEGFSNRMLDPMVYGLILEGGNSKYLIELRRMLDVGVLNLAINKVTERDVERVSRAYEGFCQTVINNMGIEEILDADILFHRELEQAVHNPLVEKISIVVERLSRQTRARAIEHAIRKKEKERLCKMHQHMLEVLRNRDEAAVITVVDEHYEYWKDEVK